VRQLRRDLAGPHFLEFVVHQVSPGQGQQAWLVQQFGIVLGQFIEQNPVLLPDVIGIGGDTEQQGGVALDVAQETMAEPLTLVCAFDDTGDVRHSERLSVAVLNDPEVRGNRGEFVVGYLRFCRRHHGE